jgi:hypothetical protein
MQTFAAREYVWCMWRFRYFFLGTCEFRQSCI